MRYFLIFILTLILISCNEKKGYGTTIEYGDFIVDISESECRDANAKGNLLAVMKEFQMEDEDYLREVRDKLVFYKGYVYSIRQFYYKHICERKRKYHDK
tara:strand:+ start:3709 stop:4008 length:300 start_codon:yes stop_codon:yes gene_type:complete